MKGINSRFNGLENFKSVRKDERTQNVKKHHNNKIHVAKDDPYMKWPVRGLAYTNEIGEVIRPMSGMLANLLWIPAIGYIAADVADKYKHDPATGNQEPSKKRASKQMAFQTFASVLLPTAAVKLGQKATNIIAGKGSTKLTLNQRENITNIITCSMNKGTHEDFVDVATGLVDRKKYTKHIMEDIAEINKHKETRDKMNKPLQKLWQFLKRPFATKPKTEHVEQYVTKTIDTIMDTRETLLNGNKPVNISKKLFRTFEEATKGVSIEQKKSAAFNVIKKMQDKKIFKNNALKSLGGFIALGLMMKPIDNFVENVLIERYISPTINVLGSPKFWKSLSVIAKEANSEAEKSAA